MVRRHVLAALADGIAAGSEDAARLAIARTEWLLRARARRRLEAALIDAVLATNELRTMIDVEASRHVQRVAALALARVPVPEVSDRAAVEASYRALPRRRVPRFPLAGLAAVLAIVLGIGGAAVAVWSEPGHARRTYHRPMPTPVAGAYEHGGVPLADPLLEHVLTGDLTRLVIATDHDRMTGGLDASRKALAQSLLAPPAIVAKGAALAGAWRSMIEMVDRWTTLPYSDNDFDQLAKDLRMRVRAVSDQLAALGLGYYLEPDMFVSGGTAHLVVYSYRVDEVVFVYASGKPHRVLSLHRLDDINLHHPLLGMQSEELGDPVLLLGEIDHQVATDILPVLAPDAPFALADKAYQGSDFGKHLASIAGAAVRGELSAALGRDAGAAGRIGALLRERGELVDAWTETLHARGWVMPDVDELFVPDSLLDSLEGQVSSSELRRVRDIDEQIARLDGARIASRCAQIVAATVRRHEAEHGLDTDRDEPLRTPPQLVALIGEATDEHGKPRHDVEHALAELSAYTSQLANDPATPQYTLWNVARFAFTETAWGAPESYAGALLVERLAAHLGLAGDGPVIHDGEVDRTRLARMIEPMAHLPADRLRAAARAAWKDFYGADLVAIVDH